MNRPSVPSLQRRIAAALSLLALAGASGRRALLAFISSKGFPLRGAVPAPTVRGFTETDAGGQVTILASERREDGRKRAHRILFVCPLCREGAKQIPSGRFHQHLLVHLTAQGLLTDATLTAPKGARYVYLLDPERHATKPDGTPFFVVAGGGGWKEARAALVRRCERPGCELDHCSCMTHDPEEQLHTCQPVMDDDETQPPTTEEEDAAERAKHGLAPLTAEDDAAMEKMYGGKEAAERIERERREEETRWGDIDSEPVKRVVADLSEPANQDWPGGCSCGHPHAPKACEQLRCHPSRGPASLALDATGKRKKGWAGGSPSLSDDEKARLGRYIKAVFDQLAGDLLTAMDADTISQADAVESVLDADYLELNCPSIGKRDAITPDLLKRFRALSNEEQDAIARVGLPAARYT